MAFFLLDAYDDANNSWFRIYYKDYNEECSNCVKKKVACDGCLALNNLRQ